MSAARVRLRSKTVVGDEAFLMFNPDLWPSTSRPDCFIASQYFTMTVAGPAGDQFVPGKVYAVTFEECDELAAGPPVVTA